MSLPDSAAKRVRPAEITEAAPGAAGGVLGPEVFNTQFYQSPVRAEPDDLLTIPGYGFAEEAIVVYKQTTDALSATPPADAPLTQNSAAEGMMRVVSSAEIPDSITVLLPEVMKSRQPYALWVKNPESGWSEPVFINDARPLWITPVVSYSTQKYASLPRELKVVGRNLEGYSNYETHVKLVGPQTYDLKAENDNDPGTAIEHYAARVKLPNPLPPGTYEVKVSRDGINWVELPEDSVFTVLPDPQPKKVFNITTYGCTANDGMDDTGCINAAISAANAAGGGEVFFPPGKWELRDASKSSVDFYWYYGLVVPRNVDLVGAGAASTTIAQTKDWKVPGMPNVLSAFTLMGDNTVKDLHLDSEGWNYVDFPYNAGAYLTFFNLGKQPAHSELKQVENIKIYNCNFSRMYHGISTSGLPIRGLFVVNNRFQAYKNAVFFSGDRFNLEDSVIRHNLFYPGDYVTEDKRQGTIASEIGASRRVDFSNNIADGHVNNGWRAAFFFHMNNNHEKVLLSQNTVACSGDKGGDGEAIIFDNNQNKLGFRELYAVTAATLDSVSVNGQWNDNTPDYYNGHYVIIADGKGFGQVRKISEYTIGNSLMIKVSPSWDVVPDGTSKIVVARAVWNSYMVDNLIDTRNCLKTNYKDQSGLTGWYSLTFDSTIEGNQLFETDGIIVVASLQDYQDLAYKDGGGLYLFLHYADEIRNNLIEGKYKVPGKYGGIQLWYGSGWIKGEKGGPEVVSPVLGYNLAVSHNQIIKSATTQGEGAIAIVPSWYVSSITPYQWKNVLIFHNKVMYPRQSRGLEKP
ncbi:MAG: glycosyl hydrolase family 28-related protein [Pseudomonadota bacterium]